MINPKDLNDLQAENLRVRTALYRLGLADKYKIDRRMNKSQGQFYALVEMSDGHTKTVAKAYEQSELIYMLNQVNPNAWNVWLNTPIGAEPSDYDTKVKEIVIDKSEVKHQNDIEALKRIRPAVEKALKNNMINDVVLVQEKNADPALLTLQLSLSDKVYNIVKNVDEALLRDYYNKLIDELMEDKVIKDSIHVAAIYNQKRGINKMAISGKRDQAYKVLSTVMERVDKSLVGEIHVL